MRSLPLCVCLLILGSAAAGAQTDRAPRAGDWIRISTRALDANPDWMVGSLATVTDRYVVIEPIGAAPLAIPHRTLTRVERQAGWRRDTRRGALVGGAAGGLVSLGLLLLTDCGPGCLAGPVAGAGLGAVVGHGRNTLHWERVEPAQLRLHHIASAPTTVPILSIAF